MITGSDMILHDFSKERNAQSILEDVSSINSSENQLLVNQDNRLLYEGATFLKIMEYFQEEKESFKNKFSYEDIEKFLSKYFDKEAKVTISFKVNHMDKYKIGKKKIDFS